MSCLLMVENLKFQWKNHDLNEILMSYDINSCESAQVCSSIIELIKKTNML